MLVCLGDELTRCHRVDIELLLGHTQSHRRRNESLPGAVVKVSFDLATLVLGGVETLIPADPQALDLGAKPGRPRSLKSWTSLLIAA